MQKDSNTHEQDEATLVQNTAASYVVDRFEDNNLVVLEDEQGVSLIVPRHWLPGELAEGDVVVVEPQGFVGEDAADFATPYRALDSYVDEDATRTRRERARTLRDSLPKGPEGDLSL